MEKSKMAAYGILAVAGIIVVGQVVRDQMSQPEAPPPSNAASQSAPPNGAPGTPPGGPPGAPPPSGTKQPDVTELKIIDLKKGTGAIAKSGDPVSVHYVGTLTDGTEFDASTKRGTPFDFTLGAGNVIPGWDEGVVGMKVGGKRKLIIPPDKGYGASGQGPIPPNATLIFEIELLKVG